MQAGNSEANELARQRLLVESLAAARRRALPSGDVRLIETHISFVLLAGEHACKIKKALDLGFLDFSTLDKRRFFCEEELRLNRRLAPQLYLEVAPIGGTPEAPRPGESPAIEYAVRMARFPQERLADAVLARGELGAAAIDALAAAVAAFHGGIPRARAQDAFGDAQAIAEPAEQNFTQIRDLLEEGEDAGRLDFLEAWNGAAQRRLEPLFAARKRDGFIRECHGDLHLGNIVLFGDAPCIFDCIEFNPNLRWIDVINEAAFLVMDLQARGRPDLASRFLSGYLEAGGDYAGLGLLAYYKAYRAMVRAKVARIRTAQQGLAAEQKDEALTEYRRYLGEAARAAAAGAPALILTHGYSASGKSHFAALAVERLGAVRIRSDVERKRLHGLGALQPSDSPLAGGIYRQQATEETYRRLAQLARHALQAGLPAVVDAAFLKRWQRDRLRALAGELGVPCLIADCRAPEALLRQRLADRLRAGGDASEATSAVLDSQLREAEPPVADEVAGVVAVDCAGGDMRPALEEIGRRLRMGAA